MKKVIFGTLILFSLFCSTSCDPEPEINEIVGEWELYRNEVLEEVLVEWDVDNETWITADQWFQNTFDWQVFLTFEEDGTFETFYADVPTGGGTWEKLDDTSYHLEYADGRKFDITLWCENSHAQQEEGNDRRIEYYRKRNTTECTDLIDYYVE